MDSGFKGKGPYIPPKLSSITVGAKVPQAASRLAICRDTQRLPCKNWQPQPAYVSTGKGLVDVTGIEPVTPCLQSMGLDSIPSIHYCRLLTFPTIRGTCFSLDAIPNGMKALDSCTVRTQS
jgi:hypothetical protein